MELNAREDLLRGVADGTVALRDVGGLSAADIFAIARQGAAAMQGGRFSQAADVFAALVALEPDELAHRVHLALARQGQGEGAVAIAVLDELLARAGSADGEHVARALLLRAELTGAADRPAALRDLAKALSLTSTAAQAVVDAALPGARAASLAGRRP